eukprot:1156732-Pelagomonas_calceolata.AAC.1
MLTEASLWDSVPHLTGVSCGTVDMNLYSNSTELSKVLRADAICSVDTSSLSCGCRTSEFLTACTGSDRCNTITHCVHSEHFITKREFVDDLRKRLRGKHMVRNIVRIHLHAHPLRVETPLWQSIHVNAKGVTKEDFKLGNLFLSFPILKLVTRVSFIPTTNTFRVAGTAQQAVQPKYLAEGQMPIMRPQDGNASDLKGACYDNGPWKQVTLKKKKERSTQAKGRVH